MSFDPYHVWLGIPPEEQPPDHYRLLGIPRFEQDAEVIAHAADRAMAHLRTFQNGPRAAYSERLLNEVAAAKRCLLDPVRKTEYDAALHAKATRPSQVPASPNAADSAAATGLARPAQWAIALGAVGMVVAAAAFAIWAAIQSQRAPPAATPDDAPKTLKTPVEPPQPMNPPMTGTPMMGPPESTTPAADRIAQDAIGELLLTAKAAGLCAERAHYKYSPVIDALVEWTSPADAACWDVTISRPGVFAVFVTYACPTAEAGGAFAISSGAERVSGKVLPGDGDNVFREEQLGFLKLAQRGPVTIQLTPTAIPMTELMRLRSIRLKLARSGTEPAAK